MNASAKLDFSKIAELGNGILPLLNAVREEEQIAWNDSVNGWLVTRHEDVMAGFQEKLPLSCVRMEARSFGDVDMVAFAKRYPLMIHTLPFWIVNSDPPLHTRLRKLMTKAFSRKVVEDLRPFAREIIADTLDGLEDNDEVEFLEGVARRITGQLIMKKFGLDKSIYPSLKKWSYSFNVGLGGVLAPSDAVMDAVESSLQEMQTVFQAELERRRAAPTEDFLSQLVMARDGVDQLSDAEILGICYLVIVAGHDTTMNTMTLGVAALCENPQAKEYLLNHPERLGDSVMELMRYVAMSTAFNRIAMEDFEWNGKQIKKGDIVWLMPAAANRDPRVFSDPEKLDLSRSNNGVTAVFGGGMHHCIGHLLAKMQLFEFFPEFFNRFPNARLKHSDLHFIPTLSFRGVTELPVVLR